MSLMSMRRKMASKKATAIIFWILIVGFIVGFGLMGVNGLKAPDKAAGVADTTVIATVGNAKITAGEFAERVAAATEMAPSVPDATNATYPREYAAAQLIDQTRRKQLIEKLQLKPNDDFLRAMASAHVDQAMVAARLEAREVMEQEKANAEKNKQAVVRTEEQIVSDLLSPMMEGSGKKSTDLLTETELRDWLQREFTNPKSKHREAYYGMAQLMMLGDQEIAKLPYKPLTEEFVKRLYYTEVKASLIYIPIEVSGTRNVAGVEKTIMDVHETLKKEPQRFNELAKRYPHVTVSPEGDLGWVSAAKLHLPGRIPTMLEAMLFSTKAGQISAPFYVAGNVANPRGAGNPPISFNGYCIVRIDGERASSLLPPGFDWETHKVAAIAAQSTQYRGEFGAGYIELHLHDVPVVAKSSEFAVYAAKFTGETAAHDQAMRQAIADPKLDPVVAAAFKYQLAMMSKDPAERVKLREEILPFCGHSTGDIYVRIGDDYVTLGKKQEAINNYRLAIETLGANIGMMNYRKIMAHFTEWGYTEGIDLLKPFEKDALGNAAPASATPAPSSPKTPAPKAQ